MTISMYSTSVPVFKQMLTALSDVLKKAETHATEKNIDPNALLQARLFPDMFPLVRQVQIAADFTKGVTSRLAGVDVPAYDDSERTFAELQARVEVLSRRNVGPAEETTYRVGDLELNRLTRQVVRQGEVITLQPRELRLLEYLMLHADQVLTRTMLLENVWDFHFDPKTSVVETHISRLRAKIDKPFVAELIVTVRGAGYMIRAPA